MGEKVKEMEGGEKMGWLKFREWRDGRGREREWRGVREEVLGVGVGRKEDML